MTIKCLPGFQITNDFGKKEEIYNTIICNINAVSIDKTGLIKSYFPNFLEFFLKNNSKNTADDLVNNFLLKIILQRQDFLFTPENIGKLTN